MDALLLTAAIGAGFFGQAHCAVMCGPLVALFEHDSVRGEALSPVTRRTAYQSGRLLSYALLGAGVGLAGLGLQLALPVVVAAWTARVVVALALVVAALSLLGWNVVPSAVKSGGARVWQSVQPLTRHVLPMSSIGRALGAGMLWGWLPCGLVYSALALALVSGSALSGAAVMTAFWAGTLPVTTTLALGAGLTPTQPQTRRLLGGGLLAVGGFSLGSLLGKLGAAASAGTDGAWQAALAGMCLS